MPAAVIASASAVWEGLNWLLLQALAAALRLGPSAGYLLEQSLPFVGVGVGRETDHAARREPLHSEKGEQRTVVGLVAVLLPSVPANSGGDVEKDGAFGLAEVHVVVDGGHASVLLRAAAQSDEVG